METTNPLPLDFDSLTIPEELVVAVNPLVLWLIFVVALIIFAVLTAVVFWHWTSFSYAPSMKRRAVKMYSIVSGICIASAGISAIIFHFSI